MEYLLRLALAVLLVSGCAGPAMREDMTGQKEEGSARPVSEPNPERVHRPPSVDLVDVQALDHEAKRAPGWARGQATGGRIGNLSWDGERILAGERIPFRFTTVEGETISHTDGTPVVLDFFASDCVHSMRQIPKVEAVRQCYERRGIRFVFVARQLGDEDDEASAVHLLTELGIGGEIAIDRGNTLAKSMHVGGTPYIRIIDRTGKVFAIANGNRRNLTTELSGLLDLMLEDRAKDESGMAGHTP